jgi:general secretion pathway protein D
MAKTLRIQQVLALAMAIALAAPIAAFAADGKKHFRDGLKFEENRQWDQAAREFALAVSEKPSNVEYQLHLQRALVSAAIMLVERGDTLADKKDYNAAYNAFRQAYAFDPSNELALIKMRRMLEAQGLPLDDLPKSGDSTGPSYKPRSGQNVSTSYGGGPNGQARPLKVQMPAIPGRKFSKTDVVYRDTNILTAIEQLAQMMKLNVMFDQMVVNQMKMFKLTVELRDVTYPKALEMILRTNNLMYAQIDSRTIVIASDNPQQRMRYEQYAVRTFYIKNADIADVQKAIQGALPSTKQLTTVKQLNAIIVRDTPSNLELVENLIGSLDKSKAEVLVDVNIYEVSRTDLLQLGNQFNVPGGQSGALDLSAIGGFGQDGSALGRAHTFVTSGLAAFALGMPPSSISFFQNKGKAKLLASTQIHVLDNEANAVRIGQRVPIQTASLPSYQPILGNNNNAGRGNNVDNITGGLNNAFGYGVPQIQYENVGLNIDITPNVYEDDVQMKMKIETTSVDSSTGTLTPSFNQRTMTSVARVKDGQTTLVAGVSQNIESKTIKGIPLIGLIPILGRFFSTPETNNRQSDVVITVTPHILRRADITEKDHYAWAAGDQTNSSNPLKIEQILYLADQDDAQPNQVAENAAPAQTETKTQPVASPPAIVPTSSPGVVVTPPPQPKPNVIKTTVPRPGFQSGNTPSPETSAAAKQAKVVDEDDDDDDDEEDTAAANQSTAPLMVYVRPNSATAAKGQDLYAAIFVNGNSDVSSAHITLSYDPALLDVKGVRDSGMLSAGARAELQFTAEGGVLNIQMDRPQGTPGVPARGQLCLVVFTVKAAGQSPLVLNDQQTQFRNSGGQPIPIKVHSSQVDIR